MRRGWMRWAFIASVAVNLLILGAVAGALVLSDGPRHGPGGRDGHRSGPPELGALARALDEPDRDALRQALRADPALGRGRGRLGGIEAELLDALRARPFDPDAFTAALAGQRQARVDLAQRGAAALAEVVAEMDDAERAAYADRVEAGSRWHRRRR